MSSADPAAVRELFERIAPRYDLLNDLLSAGLHRHWKRTVVASLAPRPGERFVDVCCGTGDLALLLAERVRPGGEVVGLDAAAAPLKLARRRAARQPWLPVNWLQGDAMASGLPTGWADGAAMAYGLRNLADPAAGLRELRRMLRPGGRAAVLDFNRPDPVDPLAESRTRFQRGYLRRVVVPVAAMAGLEEQYAYLEESLRRFPTGREQEQLALEAGFSLARHRPEALGLMGRLDLLA
ncbi:MAG: bifunctional demethylmenaquinone methyltransferase/2-methoxy-6-polyprenyl-1,4-benzoquinol methylase UbiE [Cyanobacteriota bacterium]|nr:bifunctional demethylmenaquinone methyltransferase/2-methoxy-6-polyprenyl-1,4-benzoquinol methylase UbiE [Cyanobacteriota bacterium]